MCPFPSLPPIEHDQADRQRRFHPPSPTTTPNELFQLASNHWSVPEVRFVRKSNPREFLIFIDGCCLYEGTPEARAGYGVLWGPECKLSVRLEGYGPQTLNEAELEAAIAALSLRAWSGEGFNSMVLASDSENVMLGISERLHGWIQASWITATGRIKDRNLWELLLAKLRVMDNTGIMVKFWWIPRGCNGEAHQLARAGAEKEKQGSMARLFPLEF